MLGCRSRPLAVLRVKAGVTRKSRSREGEKDEEPVKNSIWPLPMINRQMLCTDSLEGVAVHPALNATQTIPAQNIYVVPLGQLVAEFFNLNRRLSVTLCPRRWHISPKVERLPIAARGLNADLQNIVERPIFAGCSRRKTISLLQAGSRLAN